MFSNGVDIDSDCYDKDNYDCNYDRFDTDCDCCDNYHIDSCLTTSYDNEYKYNGYNIVVDHASNNIAICNSNSITYQVYNVPHVYNYEDRRNINATPSCIYGVDNECNQDHEQNNNNTSLIPCVVLSLEPIPIINDCNSDSDNDCCMI